MERPPEKIGGLCPKCRQNTLFIDKTIQSTTSDSEIFCANCGYVLKNIDERLITKELKEKGIAGTTGKIIKQIQRDNEKFSKMMRKIKYKRRR